jgi:hypothetical protein
VGDCFLVAMNRNQRGLPMTGDVIGLAESQYGSWLSTS